MTYQQIQHETEGTLLLVPEFELRSCQGCCFADETRKRGEQGMVCKHVKAFQCGPEHTIAVRHAGLDDYVAMRVAFKLTGELP